MTFPPTGARADGGVGDSLHLVGRLHGLVEQELFLAIEHVAAQKDVEDHADHEEGEERDPRQRGHEPPTEGGGPAHRSTPASAL